MKKFIPLFYLVLVISSSSCGGHGHEHSEGSAGTQISRRVLDSEVSKTVALLTVEGMTCSAGCGGKIQKELRALNGVTRTDLDFAESRPENVVSVEYDPNQVNEQTLIECVQKIADGQYHVKQLEVVEYRGLQSHGKSTDTGVSSDYLGRAFHVMDLLRSLSRNVQ
jgi:copper chaperone CopZ